MKTNGEEIVLSKDENWIMKKGLDDVRITLPLDDWTIPLPNTSTGESYFEEVDNLKDWPSVTFQAKFGKKKI